MALHNILSADQEEEDNVRHELPTTEARQGAVSGRVIAVLVISTVAILAIFTIWWLATANL
ncbi:MAG TPA: hypothetical protein VMH86_07945 [Rhizomicrobium sp.]|nr:hypothetical protein [Rhizomicrobium sp.]